MRLMSVAAISSFLLITACAARPHDQGPTAPAPAPRPVATGAGSAAGASLPLQSGTYSLTHWACGSVDLLAYAKQQGWSVSFVVTQTSASFAWVLDGACTESDNLTLAYPANQTLLTTRAGITCSAACTTQGDSCPAGSAPSPAVTDDYYFTSTGTTFTLLKQVAPADLPGDGSTIYDGTCPKGQGVTISGKLN